MKPIRSMTRGSTKVDLHTADFRTPALVWDMTVLENRLRALSRFSTEHDCSLLYSIKASACGPVLKHMVGRVSGFSCSSLFEAKLARRILRTNGSVHLTTPGFRPDEIDEIAEVCDFVSFNSLPQWSQFKDRVAGKLNCGLRINPGTSIVNDRRYDPCRSDSKLGVPIEDMADAYNKYPGQFTGLSGLHIHIACGNGSFTGFDAIIDQIESRLGNLFSQIEWFNLGGGFNFDKIRKTKPFSDSVTRLKEKFGMEVVIEPGTAMVNNAGLLVSTVIDLFPSGGKLIAVLDSTVNHMPEVFSYQTTPPVAGTSFNGRHQYVLAGSSCLAGDLFGEYRFDQELKIGERIVFRKRGAYTHGQSHWFNGINLPAIYTVSDKGVIDMVQVSEFDDFAQRCAV
jgi:carboxynorspermidine decarboxylase